MCKEAKCYAVKISEQTPQVVRKLEKRGRGTTALNWTARFLLRPDGSKLLFDYGNELTAVLAALQATGHNVEVVEVTGRYSNAHRYFDPPTDATVNAVPCRTYSTY